MSWSYEDNRFEITGCEPKRAHAGERVTVAIDGHNRGAHRDCREAWFALLVPIGRDVEAGPVDVLPPHLRAGSVTYEHGTADRFSLCATFDLPAECQGHYQLVLGRDDAHVGEHARFLVDADDFDGAFVIS